MQSTSLADRGFVICTLPRSGSNYFCEILTSTGCLGRPREYFNTDARRRYDDPDYPADAEGQVGKILTLGATSNGVYGLKMFPGLHDLVVPHLRWAERLPNPIFIRFRRKDILGSAISWVRAAQTGQFRWSDPVHGEPHFDGAAIALRVRQLAQRNARWDVYFARNGLDDRTIFYEEVVRDPAATARRVGLVMGLSEIPVVDMDKVGFAVQRDEQSRSWRQRFVEDFGSPDRIEAFA